MATGLMSWDVFIQKRLHSLWSFYCELSGRGGGYFWHKNNIGHHWGGTIILHDMQAYNICQCTAWLWCGPVWLTQPCSWCVLNSTTVRFMILSMANTYLFQLEITWLIRPNRSLRNYMDVLSMWQKGLSGILYYVSTYHERIYKIETKQETTY